MQFDYYSGRQAEQFAFFQIPKILIVDERFEELSLDAKLLYSIMLDRAALSSKNGWLDDKGRVYIIYTLEQVMADLHCANQKVSRMMKELEKIGLIERKRQGQGKPTLIYVKDFATGLEAEQPEPSQVQNHENHESEVDNRGNEAESQVLSHENHDSGVVNSMNPDSWKSCTNKTDITKTEYSETNLIYPTGIAGTCAPVPPQQEDGSDVMGTRRKYLQYFKEKFCYESLIEKYPYDFRRVDEIIETVVDVICSNKKTVRISGEEKPIEVVRSQFMKLDSTHIEYIMECFHNQVTDIHNIRQYMLTTLYNAPLTIDHYYTARVRYDMANWQEGGNA